jgi:hypothetical protein
MPSELDLARRTEWALAHWQVCMGCGRRQYPDAFLPLECHEIERRSHAPERWPALCNLLMLCHQCHAGDFSTMSHAEQLAHKLFWDRDNFNLDNWLRLRDPKLRAPKRVTYAEVIEHLEQLRERFSG